jgi:hypothetical protein
VVDNDLHRQWLRTEQYLLESKARLPLSAVDLCADDLTQFDEFISHNELGLAADWLESIVLEFGTTCIDSMKSLALAEASMGRLEKQVALDLLISKRAGNVHKTVLPSIV